jgi:hypothetical protein
MILQNQHPQLVEFMKENHKSFDNFFKMANNALLTIYENKEIY